MPQPAPVVPVRLTNRWATFDCDPDLQSRLKEFFQYEVPGAKYSEAYRCGNWDGCCCLFSRGRVAAGLFLEQQALLKKEFRLQVTDERQAPQFSPASDDGLRPYQVKALEAMIRASSVGGIVLSATGSGKTKIGGALFKRLKGAACFVVDELSLLEQSRRALEKEVGEEIGVVGRSEFRPQRITVATIQTLHRHRGKSAFKKWFRTLDVLVIDEVHLAINRRNIDVVQQVGPKAVFGLTATLQMEKPHVRMPAVALCGPVIFDYPIQEGVKEGYLSQGVIIAVEFRDPLLGISPGYSYLRGEEEISVRAGTPEAEYRRHVCLNQTRNDCVEKIVREGLKRDRRVVVLVERLLHLKILNKRFQNVKHATLCGDVEAEVRLEAMRAMDAGELKLILTTRVFGKGVDIKAVDMIIDCTALPSRNNVIQRYGRGTRKVTGKAGLIFIDIADRGNRFEGAAHARLHALKEIGAPILRLPWRGSPDEVLDKITAAMDAVTAR